MKILDVLGISPGIAIGKIFIYETEDIVIEPRSCMDPEEDILKLEAALERASVQLDEVIKKTEETAGRKDAEIFEAHQMILMDPELLDKVHSFIREERFTVEYAWYRAILDYEQMIAGLTDEYLAARSADLRDVGQRVLRILIGKTEGSTVKVPSVVVARELSPSDTVGFDKDKVLAFCTVSGGPTSHVAILSKALGIPAVVGIGPWLNEFFEGQEIIVDGSSGTVVLDPDEFMLRKYEQRALKHKASFQEAYLTANLPAKTLDGQYIEVVANIGSPKDSVPALELGAEGVGLLRTEFLFLDREFPPTEQEQYQVYKEILTHFGDKPVVARTLDIGGDKPATYLKIAEELNPFLGLRGTRLALKREEVFRSQIKALLRAGRGHNLKIMFPMIGSLPEVQETKEHVEESKLQLNRSGQPFAENVEIGIMVEIPSAAVMADILAKHVDFFSIGTNDLTQYTLAVDRTNPLVAEYADALDPSVLRLIDMVIKAAHRQGKWVGLCGELAGDPLAVPVLLGMHLDEFSMNARSIPYVKQQIRRFNLSNAEKIAEQVLNMSSITEVRSYLNEVEMQGG